jgi:hypothetical protein
MKNIKEAETYTIKLNRLLTSTKPMPIYDEGHELIGYVKIFYKSLVEKIFAFLGRLLFINLQTEDFDGKTHNRIIQNPYVFKRAEWKVELYLNKQTEIGSILRDNSSIGVARKFVYEFKGRQITMENNYVNYQTRFIDNNNYVIAQCDIELEDILNSYFKIQVFQAELDIYQIAALGLVQYYWSRWVV